MKAQFQTLPDAFVIENYNQARPFSSFLPGIAGEYGKPMWVFYTNRGQCIASFGVRNKNGAMLEFYPANKAYQTTPLLGFRTFLRIRSGSSSILYEPFAVQPNPDVRQILRIRPQEIELEETHRKLKLRVSVVFFNPPNEELPLLARDLRIQNKGSRPLSMDVLDGLPQVVPFGLSENFLKLMSRTMEAFSEVLHVQDQLPFYKLKVEPSDRPDMLQIKEGFLAFALKEGQPQEMIVDPKNIFGDDTSFQIPEAFASSARMKKGEQQTEAITASAFSLSHWVLRAGEQGGIQSYYGHAAEWSLAEEFRQRLLRNSQYIQQKRHENTTLIGDLTENFALHTGVPGLDAYSRQTFLDNTLRGGKPFVFDQDGQSQVFHYYSRKHGDMERDYNFFELAPTYYSQGNGNFRDVNQNRRSETLLYPGMNGRNLETFFNLLQFDGFNPLVIEYERFSVEKDQLSKFDAELADFLSRSFSPGELLSCLLDRDANRESAQREFLRILGVAKKNQEATHGEGYWIDHWIYNLDLLEDFLAVYPDQARALLIERRTFTYYDNDHIVQPRDKKYVLRSDEVVRQLRAVVVDPEKNSRLKQRTEDIYKVRTKNGSGSIYQTSLLVKWLGLLIVKAASLDPFGMGLEMEADKPGWCDSLNGLPALFGSSVNEAYALERGVRLLSEQLQAVLQAGETELIPVELAELMKAVGEALALARHEDFFKTWDTLASLKETFRERTRLGISGDEIPVSREQMDAFLRVVGEALHKGLRRAVDPQGLARTYFINEVVRWETLPLPASSDPKAVPVQTVRALEFKQVPVTPFLEGAVHALRSETSPKAAGALYQAVKSSELFDRKLKMLRLNLPLTKETFEVGRIKIFPPGWLENEAIFLHMSYKFLLETLRSGLVKEFFDDFKNTIVAFRDPRVYGRSVFENSSFIVSSRFPDPRLHGVGFVARLTGAAAEWVSLVLLMGLGARPFEWVNQELRFQPRPRLAGWLFQRSKGGDFPPDSFGLKAFGGTWIVYHNPGRRDTFGAKPLTPWRYEIVDRRNQLLSHEGPYLPDSLARQLREGKFSKVTIALK